MTTEEKLEEAWLAVTVFEDGSDAQIAVTHNFVCHSAEPAERSALRALDANLPASEDEEDEGELERAESECDPATCRAAADREALRMLDLARLVRDDDGDERELGLRWSACSRS